MLSVQSINKIIQKYNPTQWTDMRNQRFRVLKLICIFTVYQHFSGYLKPENIFGF